jgi:transcriptional regulator ATRX
MHTVMTHEGTGTKSTLVICPLSTVGNWYKELRQWCSDCETQPRIHKLWESKGPKEKIIALRDWQRLGGVGILHYDAFRTLANSEEKKKGKKPQPKRHLEIIRETLLDPGPDLVICDEGHLLKNPSSQQSKAVMKITTQRRVVLTGTPLQNNLVEYHTMMSFVKPNLLGTLKEFRNRFVNPIANGQHKVRLFETTSKKGLKLMRKIKRN